MTIYKILDQSPVASWPEAQAIKREVTPKSQAQQNYPSWVSEALAMGAPEGQRNAVATKLAGYFRSIRLPRDISYEILLGYAGKCTPPMDADEVRAVVDSIARYQPSAVEYQGMGVSVPIIEASISSRRMFQFPEEGIYVRVERIKEGSEDLHCWLTFSTTANGEIYGPRMFNLLADRSHASLSKTLGERHKANWLAILDVVAKSVIRSLTAQGTSVDAANVVPEASTVWLAHPLVKARQASMVYGDGGVGKSSFTITLCMSMALGRSLLPGVTVARQTNVMYLDWEGSEHEFAMTKNAIEQAHSVRVPVGTLRYRRMRQALPDELDALQHEVSEWNTEVVAIDSIVGAAGADVIEAEAARLHFSALSQLGVASINLTHITKNGANEKPYGSVFFWNYARSIWEAKADKEAGEFALFHRKANYSKLFPAFGWRVEIENNENEGIASLRYARTDLQASPTLSKGTTLAEQIEGLLRNGVLMTVTDIAEELGAKDNSVTQTLKRWQKKFVRVPPTMAWGLAAMHTTMPETDAPFAPDRGVSPSVTQVSPSGVTPVRDSGVLKSTPHSVTDEVRQKKVNGGDSVTSPESEEEIPW